MATNAVGTAALNWPGPSDSARPGPVVFQREPKQHCSEAYRSGWAEGLVYVNSGGNLLAPRAIHLSLEAWDGFMDCVELAALDVIGREKLRQRHLHEQRLALHRLGPPRMPARPGNLVQEHSTGGGAAPSGATPWAGKPQLAPPEGEDGIEVEDVL